MVADAVGVAGKAGAEAGAVAGVAGVAGVWRACGRRVCGWRAGGRRAGVAGVALSVAATVARLSFIFSILNESSARVVYSQ